jgi:hypothetical protein
LTITLLGCALIFAAPAVALAAVIGASAAIAIAVAAERAGTLLIRDTVPPLVLG